MTDENVITLKEALKDQREFFKEQVEQLRRDLERHQDLMVTRAEYEASRQQLERTASQLQANQQELRKLVDERHDAAVEAIESTYNRTMVYVGIVIAIVQVIIQLMG